MANDTVNDGERLTENVRVRLTPSEREALEQLARSEDRSASAIARRAIRRECDLLRPAETKVA